MNKGRLAVLLAALAAGCSGIDSEPVGSRSQWVIGGAPTPDALGFAIDRFQRNAVAGQLVGGAKDAAERWWGIA